MRSPPPPPVSSFIVRASFDCLRKCDIFQVKYRMQFGDGLHFHVTHVLTAFTGGEFTVRNMKVNLVLAKDVSNSCGNQNLQFSHCIEWGIARGPPPPSPPHNTHTHTSPFLLIFALIWSEGFLILWRINCSCTHSTFTCCDNTANKGPGSLFLSTFYDHSPLCKGDTKHYGLSSPYDRAVLDKEER